MTKWTEREPHRADAWFFLGAAYGVRVQYRVLRAERLSAARDGKRIKDALEKALALDPSLEDAYFGIGLYHYYADLAPAALKIVRWMLFLPGGDRARGLKEMLQARERGELLRGETDYQLHLIYLWYEQKPEEALKLLGELRERYPRNPLFVQAVRRSHNVYLHDHAASLETWRAMFNLARQGRLALPDMSEARARIGIAEELDALFETDSRSSSCASSADAKPTAPYGVGGARRAAARAVLRGPDGPRVPRRSPPTRRRSPPRRRTIPTGVRARSARAHAATRRSPRRPESVPPVDRGLARAAARRAARADEALGRSAGARAG